ncbi:MAG: glycogen/starch/alpha-glucan family phosphorylase [Verrucomicrobia bacterium]|nr:glycogen/starch/alpha-glucan family phosphorylase [Verrucomicrobiota bacterium]
MDDDILNMQAERLASKIKHYLITMMGITVDEANDEEFYRAFSLTLREEIMINWTATFHTLRNAKARTLFYLCMEYMPGRMLGNNITNMHATDLVRVALKRLGRDLNQIAKQERDPGLGNGGLGRLASCLLDSLATQQYPAVAYGLRYQYGIFDQEIWDGVQVERPEAWLFHENPWEFRRDHHSESVKFAGHPIQVINKQGVEMVDILDYEEVRAVAYDFPIIGYRDGGDFNVCTLRMWTTKESPRNFALQRFNAGLLDQASENTLLTDVLYPNDNNEVGKRIRLKQEFLLASASIQDIIHHHLEHNPDLSNFADQVRLQVNDTHPALVISELMRLLLLDHHFGWAEAWEVVKTCCSYTNHTVLRESLEEWNENRMQYLLPRQYHIIERLNLELCNSVRKKYPSDEERVRRMSIIQDGQVKMAHLAIYGSHKVNGVSALHSEILKKVVFKDFYEMDGEKFINVTNGVTQRRFLLHCNPRLAEFITKRIGPKWITNFLEIQQLAKFAADPETQKEFLSIKKQNKKDLITYLMEKNPISDFQGKVIGHFAPLDEEALFDVQIKRIHEYKRQLMNVLHLIMLYHELKANPSSRKVKRMAIFAGKAAPGYDMAKKIIQLIYCVACKINADPGVNKMLRVAFIENYNVSRAEIIIPGADLSEQISTAGTEASGTGNMKLAMNGALTLGTQDGATIEMRQAVGDAWWPFAFGKTAEENAALRPHYNPWDIYMQQLPIRQAVDALRDHSFADNDQQHQAFSSIYHSLLESKNSDPADRYFVLSDLQNYYDTQKKVEELFAQPAKWAEYAIHNISGMGRFSSDEAVHNYAKGVWNIKQCPVNPQELERVRNEYSEHDKCRILNK